VLTGNYSPGFKGDVQLGIDKKKKKKREVEEEERTNGLPLTAR
jgi:hypothetical protein